MTSSTVEALNVLRPLIAKAATYGWSGVESTMFRVTSEQAKALRDLDDACRHQIEAQGSEPGGRTGSVVSNAIHDLWFAAGIISSSTWADADKLKVREAIARVEAALSPPSLGMEGVRELQALSDAAMVGPWHSEPGAWISGPDHKGLIADCHPTFGGATDEHKATSKFIVAAVNYVRQALASISTPSGEVG